MKSKIFPLLLIGLSILIPMVMIFGVYHVKAKEVDSVEDREACGICHYVIDDAWQVSEHGQATADEVFLAAWDNEDKSCLTCHTTGYGLPGGYKIPKAGDSAAAKIAAINEGTTCEACHGPGGNFIKVHKTIMKKKSYTFDQLSAVGQIRADAASCTVCHNKRNPTVKSDFHFDYKKSKEADTHDIFHLKYLKK